MKASLSNVIPGRKAAALYLRGDMSNIESNEVKSG